MANLDYQLDIHGIENVQLSNFLFRILLSSYLYGIFLMYNWSMRTQNTVSGTIPGKVSWDCVKKELSKPGKTNNQLLSLPHSLCFSSGLQVLA